MKELIRRIFEFDKHKTTIRTELLAGMSSFLALSYIFIVNPAILSEGGIDKSVALFATIITSAIATITMGVWAKKPFVLAPGLEMNSYVVYFVILGLGHSWQEGLGVVFWSGIIFIVLTITKVREKIIDAIPMSLKIGLSASVGIFLIAIGLRISEILIYEGILIKEIGNVFTSKSIILLIGLITIFFLQYLKIRASVLISIILCSLVSFSLGINPSETKIEFNEGIFSGIMQLDLRVIFSLKLLPAIIILFVVDFFGSIAKFIGLSLNTTILNNDKKLPKLKETLLVDGTATLIGAGLGTTSITTFVESGIGIGVGGRTGFTAVTCGILMLLFTFIAPLINYVPVIATAGALLWVGIQLLPDYTNFKSLEIVNKIALMAMLTMTIVTFSLDKAMLIGFSTYLLGLVLTKKWRQINIYFLFSTLIILIATILSIIYG